MEDLPFELKHKISDMMFLEDRKMFNPRPNVIYEKTFIEDVEEGKIYEWIEINENFKEINFLMVKKLTFNTEEFNDEEINRFVNVNEFEIVHSVSSDFVFENLGDHFLKNINSLKVYFNGEENDDVLDTCETIIQDINTNYKNLVKLDILFNCEELMIDTVLNINPKLKYLKIMATDGALSNLHIKINFSNALSLKKIFCKDVKLSLKNLNLNLDTVIIQSKDIKLHNCNFINIETVKIIIPILEDDKLRIDSKFKNIKNLYIRNLDIESESLNLFENCERVKLENVGIIYSNFKNY